MKGKILTIITFLIFTVLFAEKSLAIESMSDSSIAMDSFKYDLKNIPQRTNKDKKKSDIITKDVNKIDKKKFSYDARTYRNSNFGRKFAYNSKNRFSYNKLKNTDEKILEKSKDLESVLMSVMIEPMFPEGKESMLYGGGKGSSVYRMMMLKEYGKVMANSGGIGLAENIAKDL